MDKYTKINDTTIGVEKTQKETKSYGFSFLKEQLIGTQEQKDRYIALKDAEIAEIEKLISESDKLGITEARLDMVSEDVGLNSTLS